MAEALSKITAKTAGEICRKFALSDEAKPLLKDGMTPQQFLAVLQEKQLVPDALRFLGQALPKREAVFWAYTCAKDAAGATPPENVAKALAAVNKWVLDPSEDNRRATQAAYEAADLGTPAGCAAVAAFWSGGSMAPKDLPVDGHELIALCAPRPVFISAGSFQSDPWVDAKGMFLAAVGAGPVYKLLGKRDLGTTEFPPIETTLTDGEIAFRQHSGGHETGPNWPTFIQFASRYIRTHTE